MAARANTLFIYVDDDAPLEGEGNSWNSPYRLLQSALVAASAPGYTAVEIHIAGGIYKPDQNEATPEGSGSRTASFVLVKGVTLRGGYLGLSAGPGEDPDTQDISGHESILSGDLAGDDLPGFVNTSENSLHVVRGIEFRTAILNGLTITGGHADGPDNGGENQGGGMKIVGVTNASVLKVLEISQCTFRENFAAYGGGIDTDYLDVLEIDHCTLSENSAVFASGIYTGGADTLLIDSSDFVNNQGSPVGGSWTATVLDCTFDGNSGGPAVAVDGAQIIHCTFHANTATYAGAAYMFEGGLIRDCLFDSNAATHGGAVYLDGGAANIEDCTFINNSAEFGGAIEMMAAYATLEHCHFESNTAVSEGGAVTLNGYFDDIDFFTSKPTLTSCTFVGNTAKTGGALASNACEPRIINSRFESNAATLRGGALASVGLIHGDEFGIHYYLSRPRLYGCVFLENSSPKGGAIYNTISLITIVNCTLTRNEGVLGGGVFSQPTAGVRMYNSIVRNNAGGSFSGPGPRLVHYSDIRGGHFGIGNIDVNPKFVDPLKGDLRLRASSPCIDSGRNAYLPGNILTDIAGEPRLQDNPAVPDTGIGSPYIIDMGAHEF